MLSINNAFKIIGPYKYVAAIDLTDAFFFYTNRFYSSKISKIYILSLISTISCMPNRCEPAIKVLTKISEIPVWHLNSLSHNSDEYVDDSYLQRETYQACHDKFSDTIKLLRELGSVSFKPKSQC